MNSKQIQLTKHSGAGKIIRGDVKATFPTHAGSNHRLSWKCYTSQLLLIYSSCSKAFIVFTTYVYLIHAYNNGLVLEQNDSAH